MSGLPAAPSENPEMADVTDRVEANESLTAEETARLSEHLAGLVKAGLPLGPGPAALGEEIPSRPTAELARGAGRGRWSGASRWSGPSRGRRTACRRTFGAWSWAASGRAASATC